MPRRLQHARQMSQSAADRRLHLARTAKLAAAAAELERARAHGFGFGVGSGG
eukprot:SAG22_NODE_10222_length_546_cov_2.436242_1_plen_51_part_10